MKRFILIAALAACTVQLSIATSANALSNWNPGDPTGSGGGGSWGPVPIGPGPGDPSLDSSKMPPGGDDRKNPRADKQADKEDAKPNRPRPKPAVAIPVKESMSNKLEHRCVKC